MPTHNGGRHNGIGAATAAQARDVSNTSALLTPASLLDVGAIRLCWRLLNANMNSTADQEFEKIGTFTTWLFPFSGVLTNTSGSLATAAGGVYTAASKGGIAIVSAATTYAGATSANHGAPLTRAPGAAQGILSNTQLFLSLTTGNGDAKTADLYIYGVPLS